MDRIDNQGANGIAARPSARAAAPVSRIERSRAVASQSEPATTSIRPASGFAGQDAPIDNERVDQLRAAIEQGCYRLDPHKTADAMIASGIISRTER